MKIFRYVVVTIGKDYRIETYAKNKRQAKEILDRELGKGMNAVIIKY